MNLDERARRTEARMRGGSGNCAEGNFDAIV